MLHECNTALIQRYRQLSLNTICVQIDSLTTARLVVNQHRKILALVSLYAPSSESNAGEPTKDHSIT